MVSTTIEQSKHLLELGLDPKTADMCWVKDYTGQWVLITDTQINIRSRLEGMYEYSGFQWQEYIAITPAWSLSALLEVIKGVFAYTTIAISGASKGFNFIRCKDLNYIWTHDVNADSPIGAAYEMVCLLLKQGLIKKGDNDESL